VNFTANSQPSITDHNTVIMAKRNLSGDMGMERGRVYKRSKVTPNEKAKRAYIAKTAKQVVVRLAEKKKALSTAQEASINSISQGDTWVALSNISQGSAAYERVGKEITLRRLRYRGQIFNNSATSMTVRHVVGYFLDQDTPGVGTEMFEQSLRASGPQTFSAIKGGAQEPIAMYLDLNRAKFIPIIDKTFVVGATGSVDGYNAKTFDHTVNLRDKKIRFEQSGTGTANQDQQLYAGAWCIETNADLGLGTAVEWTFAATLDYLDL